KVFLDIGELPFDAAFSVRITNLMSAKTKAESPGKGYHLGGEDSIGTGASDNQHAGIVNHTHRATAVIEAGRLEQEELGLAPRAARIVLKVQPARLGQPQPGAFRANRLARQHHAMR